MYLIDNFLYLLLQDLPKMLFPSGSRHRKSRKKKKGRFSLFTGSFPNLFSAKDYKALKKKCTQGPRPLWATEELGASGCRNQKIFKQKSLRMTVFQQFGVFYCFPVGLTVSSSQCHRPALSVIDLCLPPDLLGRPGQNICFHFIQ